MPSLTDLFQILENSHLIAFTRASVLIVAGLILGKLASAGVVKFFQSKLGPHGIALTRRAVFYGVFLLLAISALRQLGFDFSVILGAAGILTVALGFASQTSASNLISGLFLVLERSFSIGDIIRVGGTTGEVVSIDLLSVKLRTFDNLFVRIPNETLIKSEVVTLTRFSIRRIDLPLGIAYKEDIGRVRELLMALAEKNPLCLEEPPPLFIVQGFGTSSVDLQFSVWVNRENFLKLKNSIMEEIKTCFDEQSVEIPFPHMSLYAGSASEPIRVTVENIGENH